MLKKAWLMFAVAVLLSFGGWAQEKKYVIGVSMSEFTQFLVNVADVAKAAAAKNPKIAKIIILNGNADIQKQISDVESLMAQHVDAIILNPIDTSGLNNVVDRIKDAKIPLVEVNTFSTNTRYDVYVGTREQAAGEIQGDWIAKNIGTKGKFCVLYGVMGHSGQIGRWEGLKSSLLDKYPGWTLLAAQTGNWERDQGLSITEDWLQRYKDIDVIAAQNDEMALGAIQAVKEAGRQNTVKVLGIDATPDGIAAVQNGDMTITVFQDFVAQGEKSVETAVGLIEGKTYPKHVVTPFVEVDPANIMQFKAKVAQWNSK